MNTEKRQLSEFGTNTPCGPAPTYADGWEVDKQARLFRVVCGRFRPVTCAAGVRNVTPDVGVWSFAVQFADGSIDSRDEPPSVRVQAHGDDPLTPAQARELAALRPPTRSIRWSCEQPGL
jgi:hypothetical protein